MGIIISLTIISVGDDGSNGGVSDNQPQPVSDRVRLQRRALLRFICRAMLQTHSLPDTIELYIDMIVAILNSDWQSEVMVHICVGRSGEHACACFAWGGPRFAPWVLQDMALVMSIDVQKFRSGRR